MHRKKTKAGERGYLEKGLKCRAKEQFKVGVRQDRESLLGKACVDSVCGWCLLTMGSLINS